MLDNPIEVKKTKVMKSEKNRKGEEEFLET